MTQSEATTIAANLRSFPRTAVARSEFPAGCQEAMAERAARPRK